MTEPNDYTPSQPITGEAALLREHSFTRWMSRDLLQAAADFCRNLGLYVIYAETSAEGLARYILWRPVAGAFLEVRSGRTRAQFEEFDRQNGERGRKLLSLHINEREIYSAVWISAEHLAEATKILRAFGFTAAERKKAEG